eukprot:738587-Prorocentrum_lima.AAC.1
MMSPDRIAVVISKWRSQEWWRRQQDIERAGLEHIVHPVGTFHKFKWETRLEEVREGWWSAAQDCTQWSQ